MDTILDVEELVGLIGRLEENDELEESEDEVACTELGLALEELEMTAWTTVTPLETGELVWLLCADIVEDTRLLEEKDDEALLLCEVGSRVDD